MASLASVAGPAPGLDFAGGVALGSRRRLRLNTNSFPCSGFVKILGGWKLSLIYSAMVVPWALDLLHDNQLRRHVLISRDT